MAPYACGSCTITPQRKIQGASGMKYVNREMKIDQIIGYFNSQKINLIPPFQRGTVWNLPTRKKLLVNMIQARPIPAVFLYKQAEGAQFAYNILDGKQRLESLILFVGDARRDDLKINAVRSYFFDKPAADDANFCIELDNAEVGFKDLSDEVVRAFREYAIPTIEIDLDDEKASLDEIIGLFIDINQQGVKVSRFDVVKALGKDPLFKQVFNFIALEQQRGKSIFYKAINSSFVYVLKRLNIVKRLPDANSRVDRMWERLTEIALFSRSKAHRAPADILKAFIRLEATKNKALSKEERKAFRKSFDFLAKSYRRFPALRDSRLATDQPQFYTLITSLLSTNLIDNMEEEKLMQRIAFFGAIVDGHEPPPAKLKKPIDSYKELAARRTLILGDESSGNRY
jgi:hypothetical protein